MAGLFRKPGRKSFRSALSAISSLEETGSTDLVRIGSTRDGIALLELCAVPQKLHKPGKYCVGAGYQGEPGGGSSGNGIA